MSSREEPKGDGNMARTTQYTENFPARFKAITYADMKKYAELENIDLAEYVRQAVEEKNAKLKKKYEGKLD